MIQSSPKLYSIDASQFLLCLFEHYHEGVLITDHDGVLTYYNRALARLDGLDHLDVIGRSVTEIYRLEPSQSLTLQAMKLARPIINKNHIYHTANGKLVNAISSAYPLFDKTRLVGAVCTVTDYAMLMANLPVAPAPPGQVQGNKKPPGFSFQHLIGAEGDLREATALARRAASTPSSIMLVGETGTGKELFARAIHHHSSRRDGPFMAINCAAIPGPLLEGILFGTTRGAFTGAVDNAGLFEMANGGTLFLDELNSMPLELQPKLLRAVQDRLVRRIGSSRGEISIDLKIISALNQPPPEAIERGELRSDLFYRLGVVVVNLPPLRERRADIPLLLHHFLSRFNQLMNKKVLGFSSQALEWLTGYPWPGNVREMEHAVEATLNLMEPSELTITLGHLQTALPLMRFDHQAFPGQPSGGRARPTPGPSQPEDEDDFSQEKRQLAEGLRRARGNVAQAARRLGWSPQKLHYRLKKLGLDAASFKTC